MKIISRSKLIPIEDYQLAFQFKNDPHGSRWFDCDKEGNPLLEKISATGRKELEKCLSGEYEVYHQGVIDCSHNYLEPAVGQCYCGKSVTLHTDTNECSCGLLYNMFGQDLVPRDQWEEPWEE